MKTRYSKDFSIVLVLMIITSMLLPYIPKVFAIEGDLTYNTSTEIEFSDSRFYEIQFQLPAGTTARNKNNQPFNLRLWHDKHIVVYGNYKSVMNTFKQGTQNEAGTYYDKYSGYYTGSVKGAMVPGEYRYHGQDIMGNTYTNKNFKNDFTPGTLSSNKWAYLPWDNNIITKDRPKMSKYNESAFWGNTKTREWLNATVRDFEINQGYNTDGKELPSSIPDPNNPGIMINPYNERWNFIHVLTPPTAINPGEGRMWHKESAGTRYQTFSIKQVVKQPTPVELKLELLTPQSALNVMDSEDAAAANSEIEVKIRITAALKDEAYYTDLVEKVNHYTRYDISKWNIGINGSAVNGVSSYDNIAEKDFTLRYTVSQIKASNYKININGSAFTTYIDKTNSSADTFILPVSFTKIAAPEEVPPPPVMVELKPNIPDKWYDIVKFPASDNTDLTDIVGRKVYINGVQVDADQFFRGNYIFGEERIGLNHIRMVWTSSDNQELQATKWTVIYSTKPNAEYQLTGSYIQNRKMTASDNSVHSNIPFVINRYPITSYKWTFRELTGETGNLKTKEISTTVKDFLAKKPGKYQIELVVTNSLGRVSDPYIVTFTILEDYPAAVITNLNNSVIARNEPISAYAYDVVSTDGDTIASNTIELWYDSDNNETYDQLLETWINVTTFPAYTPTKLGKYKFVNKVTEEFGHPTIPEFVTTADRKSITVEREFWVDNYIPMTGIYVDIPIVRPEVDMFFMLDKNLKTASTTWIKDNRMNINNSMRMANIIATVENWDLKTYEYSQPASTTKRTGTTRPPLTITYSSNGYSGTLNRTSISDNGSYQDKGSYENETESKTFSKSWINNQSSKGWTNPWQVTSSSSNPAPSSYYINSDGYSGSIPKTKTVENYNTGYVFGPENEDGRKPWTAKSSYTAYYSGTLTKTVKVWVPDMVWVPSYTGYYEGTVYKYMKQPYAAPFATTHKKYAIYVSDGSIANIDDLNMVINKNDVDVILIGNIAAQGQITHDYFILNDGSSIEALVGKAEQWIIDQNPIPEEDIITTQNTPFIMNESDYDQEGDLITNRVYQYVQDKNYYNNSTGQEIGTQTAYSETTGWTAAKKDSFANVGLFTIYRRIQDQPTTDPNFADYNKYSNVPTLKVAVHRIPIAQPVMTWRYNAVTSLYELTFADNSYDPDHQYSRADKGIIETSMRYRKDLGEWNYKMPTDLTWGNYTIEYLVKDIEQAWSNPYIMNISLAQVPAANITIESIPIPKDVRMRGDSTIPAGEILQVTSPDKTSGPIIHSNIPINSAQLLVGGAVKGTYILTAIPSETEYLYKTNILEYTVPAAQADGNITVTVRAVSNIGNQFKDQVHTAAVYSPIWEDYTGGRLAFVSDALGGVPSSMELSAAATHDKLNDFSIKTSKYTSKLQISIGGMTYYLFKNGTVSLTSASSGLTSLTRNTTTQKFKISNISVTTGADNRIWNFKFSVVSNYPLKYGVSAVFSATGYDEAGSAAATLNKHGYNPQIKTITPNNYLLYSFRVAMVREPRLESFYENTAAGIGQKQYIDKPMFVNSMALEGADFGLNALTRGYKFKFEIDSKNFNAAADTIKIEPHFYTADNFIRDSAERDLFWEDSDHKVYRAGEGGHAAWKIITLTSIDRVIKNAEQAVWRGEYLIPATAWAVPIGTVKEQARNKDLRRDIIISFSIKGYKNGILQFDYNKDQWPKERTKAKYPYQIGDVIRYSWERSYLEDIESKDNR